MNHFLITPQAAISRIWKGAALVGVLMMSATVVFADALDTPVGIWQTIDDYTNQPKALVQITRGVDGTLSGKVVKGLDLNDSPERRCTECGDERKDQKVLGMTIIRNMKRDSDVWEGGHILDPNSGNEYSCKMYLEDGGRKLVVRGYRGVSLLGRSQTWIRQSDATLSVLQHVMPTNLSDSGRRKKALL